MGKIAHHVTQLRMATTLRRIFTKYFNSGWIPAAVTGGLLAVFMGLAYLLWIAPLAARRWIVVAALIALASAVIACCGLLCTLLWQLFNKAWKKLGVSLFTSLLLGVEVYFVMGALFVMMMLPPGPDRFAENLTIPEGIEIAEPVGRDAAASDQTDEFQQALLAAISTPGEASTTISPEISHLAILQQKAPELLQRYLAANPNWQVSPRANGQIVATRRWRRDSDWSHEGNGHYSNRNLTDAQPSSPFSIQVSIGFFDEPLVTNEFTSFLKPGETASIKLSDSDQEHYSHCVIQANGFFVDIKEFAPTQERRLTKAALAFIQNELAPLANTPTEVTLRNSLPIYQNQLGQLPQNEPSLNLRQLSQPGIYQATSWVNAREPGNLYLKAFEVTQGTPLSAKSLKSDSAEQMGWSDNPAELFLSNTRFSIYEGDWGQPYAARFEVWFSPDSGAGDRKLLERNFKIEGWQH